AIPRSYTKKVTERINDLQLQENWEPLSSHILMIAHRSSRLAISKVLSIDLFYHRTATDYL
ncbi:MAG: hypothetical protein LW720_20205, partial [Pirellula sp.]|nr:hypothetical protein [Pirellula sp.]